MTFLHDDVLDGALNVLNDNADRLDVCSQEPATFTEATSTYTLGNKDTGGAGSLFGDPEDGDTSGRKVASVAITDGSITGSSTATHWGASDTANSKLLAANSLNASQSVTSGNDFATPSFDVEMPDP